MAREIKKPERILESDLKEYAGDIVIDVTPKDELKKVEAPKETVVLDALAEQVAIVASQSSAVPGVKILSFSAWFQKVSAKNPRVKLSYREAVEAHCKAVGVGLQATEETFDAALSHFGL